MQRENIRQLLEAELLSRKGKNPGYSLRSYARNLGVDAGNLSRFLNGKKNMSEKKLKQLAIKLDVPEDVLKKAFKDVHFDLLDVVQFSLISNWYYLAILESIALDDFEPDVEWISKKINLPVQTVKTAVSQLKASRAIEVDQDGHWVDRYENITTQVNEDVDDLALRNLQKQLLKLASQSIDNNGAKEKSHTALTTVIDSDLLPDLKIMIRDFRKSVSKFINLKSKKKDLIYCLQINLFEKKGSKGE